MATGKRRSAGVLVRWTEEEVARLQDLIEVRGMTRQAAAQAMGKTKNQVAGIAARMGFASQRRVSKVTVASKANAKAAQEALRDRLQAVQADPALVRAAALRAASEPRGGCQWLPQDEPSIYRNFCRKPVVNETHWCEEHIRRVYVHDTRNKPPASDRVSPLRRPALGKRFSGT